MFLSRLNGKMMIFSNETLDLIEKLLDSKIKSIRKHLVISNIIWAVTERFNWVWRDRDVDN